MNAHGLVGEAYKEALALVEVMYDQHAQGVAVGDRINTARDAVDEVLKMLDEAENTLAIENEAAAWDDAQARAPVLNEEGLHA